MTLPFGLFLVQYFAASLVSALRSPNSQFLISKCSTADILHISDKKINGGARKHYQQGPELLLQAAMWQDCEQKEVQENHKAVAASKETSLHEGIHSLVREVRTLSLSDKQRAF